MPRLRAYVRVRIRLPRIQLGEYLVRRVPAPRAVALQLPRPPELLGRSERDTHVVQAAQRLAVEAQQAFNQQELGRPHVDRRLELTGPVAVHGLEHRLSPAKMRDVLREDVEVVRVR